MPNDTSSLTGGSNACWGDFPPLDIQTCWCSLVEWHEEILLAEDRILADRLRLAASALGIEVLDCLLISEQNCWSGRIDGRWL